MSNTADLLNLAADILKPIGIPINKVNNALSSAGTERIVLNAIPNDNVTRWGANRMNRFILNINAYVPKLTDGQCNSARLGVVEGLIIAAIESANDGYSTILMSELGEAITFESGENIISSASTTRVKYYSLDCGTGSFFNDSANESLVNIRVKATIT